MGTVRGYLRHVCGHLLQLADAEFVPTVAAAFAQFTVSADVIGTLFAHLVHPSPPTRCLCLDACGVLF